MSKFIATKKELNTWKCRVFGLGLLAMYLTGCGVFIAGSPEGIKSYMDGMNGLVSNGKATPNTDTPHWRTRRAQEHETTNRAMAPSILDHLFGSSTPVHEGEQSSTGPNNINQKES